MGNMTLFIAGIAILSLGTYLMRLGGAKLGNRLAFSERSQALLSDAATVLLFSVALATTFYEGAHFAGMARVLGVAFAVFLAWRKVPLIGVIIAAAVLSGDRAFKPLNNRFDLQRVPLVYRQYRS
ncbi:AzlD domain-containing protein [Klebsiella pneumoniae]